MPFPFCLAKRAREIAEYREHEVDNIFWIWLQYELYNGRLSYQDFRGSEAGPE
jgi:hypothetical protein